MTCPFSPFPVCPEPNAAGLLSRQARNAALTKKAHVANFRGPRRHLTSSTALHIAHRSCYSRPLSRCYSDSYYPGHGFAGFSPLPVLLGPRLSRRPGGGFSPRPAPLQGDFAAYRDGWPTPQRPRPFICTSSGTTAVSTWAPVRQTGHTQQGNPSSSLSKPAPLLGPPLTAHTGPLGVMLGSSLSHLLYAANRQGLTPPQATLPSDGSPLPIPTQGPESRPPPLLTLLQSFLTGLLHTGLPTSGSPDTGL